MAVRPFTLALAVVGAICVTATAAAGQVTVRTSADDVVQFSEKNVVDHMIRGDSIETEMARVAGDDGRVARDEAAAAPTGDRRS